MEVNSNDSKLNLLNLIIIVLSIYVLIALLLDTFFKLPPEISRILFLSDNVICAVFLYDFCLRFYRAESKLKFMKWGWIDLLSSIPAIDVLRVGRSVRLIRLLRLLRAFRSTKHLINHIFRKRAQGTFVSVSIIAFLLIIFSSIAILQVEDSPDSNIKTAEDALWWAYVTTTTVGYGDKYPVTTEGRIIAGVLMTAGVGLFGTYTAYVATWFISGKKEDENVEVTNN